MDLVGLYLTIALCMEPLSAIGALANMISSLELCLFRRKLKSKLWGPYRTIVLCIRPLGTLGLCVELGFCSRHPGH